MYLLLILTIIIPSVSPAINVIMSVLSTNDFLLPAKVLALSLKLHNVSAPLILLCTEGIAESTKQRLHNFGIQTLDVKHIDGPEAAIYSSIKLKYTKLHLWSMIDFTTILYLDLDVLVTEDISELFRCGSFCAVMRHSDMFNFGIFVLRPNVKVYKDMLSKLNLPSYDHGDQGFINSYFPQLKFSRMFDSNDVNWPNNSDGIYRLPSAYNYDIGMYYIQGGRMLIKPKIIHYTLGPTKPWLWWTYPLFDLNYKWLEIRNLVVDEPSHASTNLFVALFELTLILTLFAFNQVLKFSTISLKNYRKSIPSQLLIVLTQLISTAVSFLLVPEEKGPKLSWFIFLMNQLIILLFLNVVRIRFFDECSVSPFRVIQYFGMAVLSFLLVYFTLSYTAIFGTRVKLMFILVPCWFILVSVLCRRLKNGNSCKFVRYESPNKI